MGPKNATTPQSEVKYWPVRLPAVGTAGNDITQQTRQNGEAGRDNARDTVRDSRDGRDYRFGVVENTPIH